MLEPLFENFSGGFCIKFMLPVQVVEAVSGGDVPLNGALNEGLNEGLKFLLKTIQEKPGVQAKDLGDTLNRPIKTIERQVKALADKNLIERRGSKKTGGYWAL